MIVERRFKKSAIGATTVTLVPSTAADSENRPNQLSMTQIVVTTPATPPAEFWGTVTTDGVEYLVTITRKS